MPRRIHLLSAFCVGLMLLAVMPASMAAAAAPSHRCADNEVITHGSFGIFNATGVRCTVSYVNIEHGYEFYDPADPVGQLTATASTFGSLYLDQADLTLTSSTVKGLLNVWYDPVVSIDRSYLAGGMAGADTDSAVVANELNVTKSTVVGSFQTFANELTLADDKFSGGYFRINGDDEGGPDDPPERFTVTIERTRIGTDVDINNQQRVQLCGVHVTGSADIEGVSNLYLGGFVDPNRSCGSGPTVRIDGNLTFDAGAALLRNVAVGGTLDCGGGRNVVLQHVTVRGKRVTHC